MKFNSFLFKRKKKVFRKCWDEDHFLTYDKKQDEFIEHNGGTIEMVWYWENIEDAKDDLTADDWRYV